MNRRKAIEGIVGASVTPLAAAQLSKPEYYELRYYQLRNGYSKKTLPDKPSGAGPIGMFNPVIGENSPYVLVLLTHASLADAEHAPELDLDYVRYERTILRAFSGTPRMHRPPESKNAHLFELRTYESTMPLHSAAKSKCSIAERPAFFSASA